MGKVPGGTTHGLEWLANLAPPHWELLNSVAWPQACILGYLGE